MKKKVYVVCQTHWDREHRSGFQETRMMLVEMIDRLIEILDNEPDFNTFIIDGQTIVLDDYLEIKPYMRDKLKSLVKSGKLQIGPWYTLPDHTPANPESIIRNLLYGKSVCEEFGKRMDFGYSIFSFGQIGQLPQIYQNFGINELIFYKGAPLKELKHNEFFWQSPDGSKVLSSRLGDWFRCNFFVHFTVPVLLGGDMNKFEGWKCLFNEKRKLTIGIDQTFGWQPAAELEPNISIRREAIPKAIDDVMYTMRNSASESVKIAMEGIDFSCPVAPFAKALKAANEVSKADDIEFIQSDLKTYFEAFKADVDLSKLKTLVGEMRYGPIGKIHSETMSSATMLKQRLAVAENMLLHYIEPYAAMMTLHGVKYPKEFIMEAWRNIMKVQAHDSIHGAGAKEIIPNSIFLLNQAIDIAQGVAKRGFESIIKHIDTSAQDNDTILITLFNPLPHQYSGVVRVQVAIPREDYAKKLSFVDMKGERVESYLIDREDKVLGVVNPENRPKSLFVRQFTVDLYIKDIPALGYKTICVEREKNANAEENPFGEPQFAYNPIVQRNGVLDNGLIRVQINPDCTLNILDKESGCEINRTHVLRDSGDVGNVWVTIEPSFNQSIIPLSPQAQLMVVENSSLKGSVAISYSLSLPVAADKDKRRRTTQRECVSVTTEITVERESKMVKFKTSFDNIVEDHKLSVVFPTNLSSERSHSEGSFEIIERPIDYTTNNNGVTGDELLRHPMQRFVDISDGERSVALLSKGIHEFATSYIDNQAVVELTLLRSVTQRFPIHGDVFIDSQIHPSQSQGKQLFEYALYLHEGDHLDASIQRVATQYVVEPAIYQHSAGERRGDLPLNHSFISKENDLVALHGVKMAESEESIILRLCNPTPKVLNDTIDFESNIKGAWLCSADESVLREIDYCENSITFDFEPYKIVTLKVIL